MKTVPLTKRLFALINDEDSDENKWSVSFTHGFCYVERGIYNKKTKKIKKIKMHRQIMENIIGRKLRKSEFVDHKNHNGLDNRRCNLRICTRSQNKKNTPGYKNNTSGFNGVFWCKDTKRWRAKIGKDNKEIHIGYLSNPKDAARAFDKKALELYGEFTALNFPDEKQLTANEGGGMVNG